MTNVGEAEINVSRAYIIIVVQQIEFYLTLWVRLALSTLVFRYRKIDFKPRMWYTISVKDRRKKVEL